MTDKDGKEENFHALLIGIDFYLPNKLPDGSYYPSLTGCVRDIQHVQEFLIRKLGISENKILRLTSSNNSSNILKPCEPEQKLPTYENIINAFKEISETANSGDQVYIHYSGHGGRVKTILPHIKGETGLDETLVPFDIGDSESRHIRDIEIAKLLRNMLEKKLMVTIVIDSCHSGGATRGQGGAVPRGISSIDSTPRRVDSLVAPVTELSNTWETWTSGRSIANREISSGSGWLPEPLDYVLIAACRPSESSYEYAFEGTERNGALTYWLLKSLEQLDENLTYKLIHDRLVAKIHSQFELQTPMLEGDGDRVVFGNQHVRPIYAVNVMKVQSNDGTGIRVLLNAGQVHGMRNGIRFAVYPYRSKELNKIEERVALVEIVETGSTNSWTKVIKNFDRGQIDQGAQAVLIDSNTVSLKKLVRLIYQDDLLIPTTVSPDKIQVLKEIENSIAKEGYGFLEITSKSSDKADYQVAVNQDREFEIWDPSGNPISNLNPPIKMGDHDAAANIIGRLVHLTKYRNIQQLDNLDAASPITRKLVVELFGLDESYRLEKDTIPEHLQSLKSEGNSKIVKVGQKMGLKICNKLDKEVINIAVLDLQPDWGIAQIDPRDTDFRSLDPGQSFEIDYLQADLPASYSEGKDILKVFATMDQTSFHWLQLPALDHPSSEITSRAALNTSSPLEKLFALLTKNNGSTRQLIPATCPSKEWTTVQIEVQIVR